MNRIAERLAKLEKHAEKTMDLSGRKATTEAQRVFLRELSTVPGAVELAREQVDLMLMGVASDSPEMLDVNRRIGDLWNAHCASKTTVKETLWKN